MPLLKSLLQVLSHFKAIQLSGSTPENLQGVEERMHQLEDHTLIRLLAIEQSDYLPEAIDIAHNELRRRGLKALDAEGYYEKFPLERVSPRGFCVMCYLETTDESPGNTSTVNFVGTRLIGFNQRCFECGSVLQRKWYCLGFPIVPLGQYRVLYLERGLFHSRYIGRKLRSEEKVKKGRGSSTMYFLCTF